MWDCSWRLLNDFYQLCEEKNRVAEAAEELGIRLVTESLIH